MKPNKPKQSIRSAGQKTGAPKPVNTSRKEEEKRKKHWPLLPIPVVAFVLIWIWAGIWQGDVFRMAREYSFFAPDETLMQFELCKPYGMLWTLGRCLLMTFRSPLLGGALLALILTLGCWLLGYAMRLSPRWRWIQWLPLSLYTCLFAYNGLNNYFEAETGMLMGIPCAILAILLVWGIIIRSFSRKKVPAFIRIPWDETPADNYTQLGVVLLVGLIPSIIYGQLERDYVRPIASMQVSNMQQDWEKTIKTAEANAEMSYRPFAAHYAIALVQTNQITDRLFNIRLDYDSLHIQGFNGDRQNALNMYLMECDLHAGLVQTAYHHAMENMAMEGPTLRNLKMLCKTALLRGEWELADKYLTIIGKVPFEGDFVDKYRPMLHHTELVNSDPEFAVIRQTEPMHDNFENRFIQPVFLGYNAALTEGRSISALYNSLMVNIYTKTMPDFLMRCQGLEGGTQPASISQALVLMSSKYPEVFQHFSSLAYYQGDLQNFITETSQYIQARPGITEEEKRELLAMGITPSGSDSLISSENRALHARELFPRYKGYYPYYYFFGNLKATKKKETRESSNAGVN